VRHPAGLSREAFIATLSTALSLEPLEIAYQIANLIRIQSEFGHIWMAGDDAFPERFFECFDRITVVKFSKWRCQLERTCRCLIDGVATCAVCRRKGQTPLLPGFHLGIRDCAKNQIANGDRNRTLGYLNFMQKAGAHESDLRLCVFEQRFFDLLTVERPSAPSRPQS
jgi:hypothetical protein